MSRIVRRRSHSTSRPTSALWSRCRWKADCGKWPGSRLWTYATQIERLLGFGAIELKRFLDITHARAVSCCLILALVVLAAAAANAHFLLNLNVRILHVEHLESGLRVYLRTPMPYLVADKVGRPGQDGLPEPAPFTTNTVKDGKLAHLVNFDQLKSNPLGLGALAEQGFDFPPNGSKPPASSRSASANLLLIFSPEF